MAITYKEIGSLGGTFEKSLRPVTTFNSKSSARFLFNNKKPLSIGDEFTIIVRAKRESGSSEAIDGSISGVDTFKVTYSSANQIQYGLLSVRITEENITTAKLAAQTQKALGEDQTAKADMAANGISTFDEYIKYLESGRVALVSHSGAFATCTVEARLLEGFYLKW